MRTIKKRSHNIPPVNKLQIQIIDFQRNTCQVDSVRGRKDRFNRQLILAINSSIDYCELCTLSGFPNFGKNDKNLVEFAQPSL